MLLGTLFLSFSWLLMCNNSHIIVFCGRPYGWPRMNVCRFRTNSFFSQDAAFQACILVPVHSNYEKVGCSAPPVHLHNLRELSPQCSDHLHCDLVQSHHKWGHHTHSQYIHMLMDVPRRSLDVHMIDKGKATLQTDDVSSFLARIAWAKEILGWRQTCHPGAVRSNNSSLFSSFDVL